MSKLCKTFQSPYNRGRPLQASMLFHTTYLPLSDFCGPFDCGEISGNIFFLLNLLMEKSLFDKNHWFQLRSTKNDRYEILTVTSQIEYYLKSINQELL